MDYLDALDQGDIEQISDNQQWFESLDQDIQLNINTCTESDLIFLNILTPFEIQQFLFYRGNYGPFYEISELQVLPGIPLYKLKALSKYMSPVEENLPYTTTHRQQGYFQIQASTYYPLKNGFISQNNLDPAYNGSRYHIITRYKTRISPESGFGLAMEKDAGETFIAGHINQIENYHFHYFKNFNKGLVRNIIIGDFTANWGQGILLYQGFGITKSRNTMMIRRSSPSIKPYLGLNEYNFFRGLAIGLQQNKNWKHSFLLHRIHRDATIHQDSIFGTSFSNISQSGLHRTKNEINAQKNILENIIGLSSRYQLKNIRIGLHNMYSKYNIPYRPAERIYNIHIPSGSSQWSQSMDINALWASWNIFGEIAISSFRHKAYSLGLLTSLDPQLDLSILLRKFEPGYRPLYGNAFSARSTSNNEKGLYLGLQYYPTLQHTISLYLDQWHSLFPTSQTTGPGINRDVLLQYQYKKKNKFNYYLYFKYKWRADNVYDNTDNHSSVFNYSQYNVRIQFSHHLNKNWQSSHRVEYTLIDNINKNNENGVLISSQINYQPSQSQWKGVAKLIYYHTDSFFSRIYSYASDVRYSYSLPFFYGKGWSALIKTSIKLNRRWQLEGRVVSNYLIGAETIGSGDNAINGPFASEVKIQLLYTF
ncbi:helix-hairpin-helix domain-containing protein [Membranihabitans marinus]